MLQIQQVDAEELEAEILNRDRPLIIDFYATWCGPCVLLAKELETVSCLLGAGVVSAGSHCHCLELLVPRAAMCNHPDTECILVLHVRRELDKAPACEPRSVACVLSQVAERMGEAVRILKIDTDKNPDISTQLQARTQQRGAPTRRRTTSLPAGLCWGMLQPLEVRRSPPTTAAAASPTPLPADPRPAHLDICGHGCLQARAAHGRPAARAGKAQALPAARRRPPACMLLLLFTRGPASC